MGGDTRVRHIGGGVWASACWLRRAGQMGESARARTAMTRTAEAERGIAHDATRLQERRAVGARACQPAAVADGNQDEDGDRRAGGERRRHRQTDRGAGAQTDRY